MTAEQGTAAGPRPRAASLAVQDEATQHHACTDVGHIHLDRDERPRGNLPWSCDAALATGPDTPELSGTSNRGNEAVTLCRFSGRIVRLPRSSAEVVGVRLSSSQSKAC